ncbi:class I poly(R)-hydroxyalkanoic acid synthase [Sandaracinobacteroides saxicola]|uniref:Class I poly(R)-hydroxyalkanoic acid synthase n=2 Tax=Sandaracinobacteroides saxicola TaxID=2759707 RepID=A0A7G5IM72_9SPHN|nr:class I poly(R)-hydroxyalkanoic acid synthase [Sandaracinobacteroides saxicola]
MMLDFWQKSAAKLPATLLEGGGDSNPFAAMAETWEAWARASHMLEPGEFVRMQTDFWQDSLKLWSGLLTGDLSAIPAAAAGEDRRFRASAWSEQPVFDMLKRSYLLASAHILEGVGRLQGLSDAEMARAKFQAKQFVDAMSPTNFALTNPEVLAAAQSSDGESLVRGLENMLRDLQRGQLTLTDESAFEVGVNVAATPGKVVFENRLFQLIQYSPTTESVHAEPLLIFPPWINKFYILDLTAEKSFIRWAVAEGLTVFVVSWRNADESLADVVLDNYVLEGQVAAIDAALAATGAKAVHAIGYCVAGTTLAVTLAYLAAKGEAAKVATATYFTAQVDFAEAGDLLNFIDETQLATIGKLSEGKGYLDGRYLAATFNMLRPTDLIWNYVVNNYLLGKEYAPFDLLFWNSDATNVPAKWHGDYIRQCYRDNLLVSPGAVRVAGVAIELKKVTTPAYVQAGKEDHIAPLKSVWKLTKAFSGPVRFVLAGSGHIAGVVNPPSSGKYQHWTLPEGQAMPERVEDFQAAARETKGSWWPDWSRWIAAHSSGQVAARVPGAAPGFAAIEEAPGRYVKARVG